MTYYIYVPFKQKEVPKNLQTTIEQWVQLEETKAKDIVVTYQGEKGLEELPRNAKIYVLMYGQATEPSPLSQSLSSESARNYPSLSSHIRLTEGEKSRLVPDIADKMVEDGLFKDVENLRLRIKLFFFNAGDKAKTLAESFKNALVSKNKEAYGKTPIKVDYYEGQPKPPSKPKDDRPVHKYLSGEARTSSIRYSIYSNNIGRPKLTIEQVKLALTEYNEYKSARCCGLSGLLGWNGLFSSNESTATIGALQNSKISDERRFTLAKQFLADYSENQFAKCLSPKVEASKKAAVSFWKSEQAPKEIITPAF